MHERQKALDGIGWIDPDKSKREGKACVITAHSTARSGFRTWAKDDRLGHNRMFDQEAAELCLLHCKVSDDYHGAYDRARLSSERQRLMDDWGEFCCSLISGAVYLTQKRKAFSPKSLPLMPELFREDCRNAKPP